MHRTDRLEDAVLAVLGGVSVEDAARTADTEPALLSEVIERYQDAGRAALEAEPSGWHQANIRFTDYPTGHRIFRAYLQPALRTGPVGSWWFVRKHPHWRLRYYPAPGSTAEDAVRHVAEALDSSVSWNVTAEWSAAQYEPEVTAFGGPDGMALAHELFHADSVGVIEYQAAETHRQAGLDAKAVSLLAMSMMMRSAGLEFGEQGDVWGLVEVRRPLTDDVTSDQVSTMVEPMRRLLLADAQSLLESEALAHVQPWISGLETGGRALEQAAAAGKLSLGMRGILARHVIFHWNRMGFTLRQQSIWSRAAREAVLGR
ncbi:thiopeptide-type bacteriocin biosynthesis protein [Kitasatospora sp. MBT66]|uniref:thiopeptide-type bacteriocin biosynthesis protein n=1 Tax=Kitasatospora sp. MBT66 TaxID=1444769 RepID=UPI0005BB36A5|nr:thiopeptide-type bacteriocin biosynthesis protein [Kitasatospora sp. MBT66]